MMYKHINIKNVNVPPKKSCPGAHDNSLAADKVLSKWPIVRSF